MQVSTILKKKVQAAIKANLELKKAKDKSFTNNRHAYWMDIHPSIYSRALKGETERILSDGEWVRLAMKLHIPLDGLEWQTAQTKTYRFIRSQILACMQFGIGGMFCDDSSIGKTYTAECVDLEFPNVSLVDCSRNRTWSELVRAISRGFGFNPEGRIRDIEKSLIENIYTLDNPIIILDEVGDLKDDLILRLKGLTNATTNVLGWYIMGANGFRTKLEGKLDRSKVGYEEWFNRLGNRVQSIIGRTAPGGTKRNGLSDGEIEIMKRKQIEQILNANIPNLDPEELAIMVNSCDLNARRARIEILKHNKKQGGTK